MSEHAAELAEQLVRYPLRHCVAGPYVYGDFDAEAVAAVLRGMLPQHAAALRVDAVVEEYEPAAAAVGSLSGASVRPRPCALLAQRFGRNLRVFLRRGCCARPTNVRPTCRGSAACGAWSVVLARVCRSLIAPRVPVAMRA